MKNVVVIGGGQAGHSMAAKLRSNGFEGKIVLVCSEPTLPYQRPPLSKKYLTGEFEMDRLLLRPSKFYDDNAIEVRLNETCQAIDAVAKTVELDSCKLEYDQLVLATGSTPIGLPAELGGTLHGVHTVRSIADIDKIRSELRPQHRILVVGGGYIGLETAASCSQCGCTITVVELADRILQRVAAPETSDSFRSLHERHGVKVLESTALERLVAGEDGRVAKAVLKDRQPMEIDMVILGIGIRPETRLAESAGLEIDNGIRTDPSGRTSVEGIWAAGDCSSFPFGDRRIRLESVQNAIDQAELVADNILGSNRKYAPVPWFWSDQFDAKLQIAGLGTGYDRIVTRRKQDSGAASYWYFAGSRLLAVDAINDPRSYMIGKRLLEMGRTAEPEVLSDPESNLKSLLR